jgi:hypothetical protein
MVRCGAWKKHIATVLCDPTSRTFDLREISQGSPSPCPHVKGPLTPPTSIIIVSNEINAMQGAKTQIQVA